MQSMQQHSPQQFSERAPQLVERAKVEIMGKRYTLRGDVDSDYMVSLARYVDGKVKELKSMSGELDSSRLAILVALNIADELFQERNNPQQIANQQREEDLKRISEKTNLLIQMIEKGLVGSPVH